MTQLPVPIPLGYKVLVSVDQKVSQGDVIASSESASQDFIIELAKDLETDPKNTEKFLVKKPGDRIEAGGVIGKKGGVMGSREVRSKVGGTVVNYDPILGQLIIRTSDQVSENNTSDITSPVDGKVVVCDNEKVLLETDKEAIMAMEASGATAFGEAFQYEKDEVEALDLDSKLEGKILVGKTIDREAVAKAIGLKAIGVVAENIDPSVFENLDSKKIVTPVLRVDSDGFKKIHKKSGKFMLDSKNRIIIRI